MRYCWKVELENNKLAQLDIIEQLGKRQKNTNYLGMSRVCIIQFHSVLGGVKHRNV